MEEASFAPPAAAEAGVSNGSATEWLRSAAGYVEGVVDKETIASWTEWTQNEASHRLDQFEGWAIVKLEDAGYTSDSLPLPPRFLLLIALISSIAVLYSFSLILFGFLVARIFSGDKGARFSEILHEISVIQNKAQVLHKKREKLVKSQKFLWKWMVLMMSVGEVLVASYLYVMEKDNLYPFPEPSSELFIPTILKCSVSVVIPIIAYVFYNSMYYLYTRSILTVDGNLERLSKQLKQVELKFDIESQKKAVEALEVARREIGDLEKLRSQSKPSQRQTQHRPTSSSGGTRVPVPAAAAYAPRQNAPTFTPSGERVKARSNSSSITQNIAHPATKRTQASSTTTEPSSISNSSKLITEVVKIASDAGASGSLSRKCKHCGEMNKLSDDDASVGQFDCSKCSKFNDFSKEREESNER